MSSLVKFRNQIDGGNRGMLFWGRAVVDGLPFRGPQAPMLRQEEYEARVVRVADPQNGTFKTWVQGENDAYRKVMDMILNGWAQCIFVERWRDAETDRHVVYIEWAQYYMEDGAPTSLQSPQELSYGQPNLLAGALPGQS